MSSKAKCILKKRKEILHEKLNQITGESENTIDLIQDMQLWATSIVSELDLETDEREFLLKYPTVAKRLEEWQSHISRISYELDVLVCEENRRTREESNTTSTTSQHRKKEVQCKFEEVPRIVDVTLWTIPCPLQENDILDMRYVSGDTPHDFWLRFYSTEELKEISSGIQKLFEENKLQSLKSSEVVGCDVCVCNGSDYFRGRVISRCTDSPMSYSILNVDNGGIVKVERAKLYNLTKEIAKFQVQAINCCLEGDLGDPVLWDDCAVKMFHQVMEDSSLVVTICTVPTETCTKFVVKVDAHNKMHVESKIDLSSWITYSVLPTLIQRRTSQSADTLKSHFTSLCTKSELENSTSLMENSKIERSPKHWDVERKENKDTCVKEHANGTNNSNKEKSNVQQPPSSAGQQSNSFLSLNSTVVPSVSCEKEKSNVQQPPSSAGQQSNSFLSLNSTVVPSVSSEKEKSDVQQPPLSAAQQSNSFVSLSSMPLHVVPPQKEKVNMQQPPTSTAQQSDSFLSLNSTAIPAMSSKKEKSSLQQSNSFPGFNSMPVHVMEPQKEKSSMQQSPTNAAQQSNCFPGFNSMPVHAMEPQKEKLNMQQSPTNAVQQSNCFPGFNSMPVHAMHPQKEKSNVQQWSPGAQQQPSAFLSIRGAPLHAIPSPANQYVHHFLPYQSPPMLVPPVSPPVYPYAHQMQPPFLGTPHFSNALQQQTQPQSFQLQITSQNKLLVKQGTAGKVPALSHPTLPQSSVQDTQIGRACRTRTSLEDKQKDAVWVPNTLCATRNQMQSGSVIKQASTADIEAVKENVSVCKQETSPQKVNSSSTNGMNRVSLKHADFKFEIGARYKAFVVHINDPDDFYVHMACVDTAFIEDLDAEMTKNYTTCSFKLKNKEQAKKMLYESWCAVFYEDEHLWHRGKVVDWMDDKNTTLKVQYVDYGEVREIDLSMIKPLKAEYTKLPVCATRCRLAKIHPPRLQENTEQLNIWPSETIELFKVLAVRDKLHSIVVTNTSTDPISVLLVGEDNIVINKALLDYEYAVAFEAIEFDPSLPFQLIKKDEENVEKPRESSWKEEKDEDDRVGESVKTVSNSGNCEKVDDQESIPKNWDPMTDDFFSVDNTEYHDDENACYAVSGYIPQDERRICKFYAENGHCFKGVTCTKEHSVPNPDGWTTDRETVLQDPFSSLVLPPVGTVVVVEATAIYTVNMFNAHVHWEGRIKEGEETLSTLNKYINNKDNVSKMKRLHITPAVGQLVLARFVQDGASNFFRARVIDTSIEENKVQVVYIDYGNIEWVSEKDIREMEPKYLHLPSQAVECYISNVNPKTDSEEALHEVSDLILGKQLVGTLTSKDILGHAEVEIWDGDEKIADKLIEKGYAEYRQSPLFFKEDASIIPG